MSKREFSSPDVSVKSGSYLISSARNTYARRLALGAFLLIFGCGMNQPQSGQPPASASASPAQAAGRDFRSLSVSPDGDEMLFVEVDERLPEKSRVMRYNLKKNSLQHYVLPNGYIYTQAKLSPSGQYIAMARFKEVLLTDQEKLREAMDNKELVIMKSDGTDFRVLNLSLGLKGSPVFSNDDTKLAYVRGSLRPPQSKSFASRMDIWEVDLKTGTDKLFAGNFEFFSIGQMQYLSSGNEILFQAYGPREYAQSMGAYRKKYNSSEAYKISRGQTNLPEPIFNESRSSMFPMVDDTGRIHWYGEDEGLSFFRKNIRGETEAKWMETNNFPNIIETCIDPNGSFILFVYSAYDSRPTERNKWSIGMLDMRTPKWESLYIPPLSRSVPLPVRLAD